MACLCLIPPSLSAAGALDAIHARGELRVAVKNQGSLNRAEHNDPAHFQKRGFELDLAKAIAAKILGSGGKIDLKMFKRRQRLPAVADGTVDLGIAMFAVNEDDQRRVDFSHPYYQGGLAVVQKSKSTVTRLADLNGMKVAALDERMSDPGGTLQRLAAVHGAKIKVMRYRRFEDAVQAVESGDADALVSMNANLDAYIAHGHEDLKRSPLLSHERFAVAVPKGDSALLATVNGVIDNLKQSGRLDAMIRQWKLSTH
jgi:putative glutamine transport system substrate-binding protein